MSHGSGEEENYWPGYVDALTSMVQVLAFVMMLLAMAVFVLSQNVSKSAVLAIAKAAKMDVPPDANVNQLTAIVIDELARIQSKAAPPGLPPPAPTPAPAESPPAEASKAEPTPQTPMPKPAVGAAPPPSAPERADPTAQSPVGPGATTSTTQRSTLSPKPLESVPQPSGAKVVVLHFDQRSFKPDSTGEKDVDQLLGSNQAVEKSAPLAIRAYAASSDGALSEARRLAYYRAMSIRKMLTDRKVAVGKIRIVILDTQDKAQGSTADVFINDQADKP